MPFRMHNTAISAAAVPEINGSPRFMAFPEIIATGATKVNRFLDSPFFILELV
jgi:hypothetical protein